LDHPHLTRDGGTLEADRALFHLGPDNNLESVVASGNVTTRTWSAAGKRPARPDQSTEIKSRSDRAELLLTGKESQLRTVTLTGNVQVEQAGPQPIQGGAGRVILEFASQNQLRTLRASDGARLAQRATDSTKAGAENFELTAPALTFDMAKGNLLERAETSGAAKITISSGPDTLASKSASSSPQTTVVTAGKFEARFATDQGKSHLATIHGAPDARIVSSASGEPDRTSTSDSVDAIFLSQGGIQSVTQQGNVAYSDNQPPDKRVQAWANTAHYTPSDQMLILTGSPRVTSAATVTTAKTIRINRATGEAVAENDVKSTYSELREQPDGALLASSSPIHVTARSMTAQGNPGVALYTGNARLWQDANVIEAPSIQFDRNRRFVTAQGTLSRPVQTILIQPETGNPGKKPIGGKKSENGKPISPSASDSSPITISAAQLIYADSERRVHYEGGVQAKGTDFTASCRTLDAYLVRRGQVSGTQPVAGPGQLERMVAEHEVVIQQTSRRAEGQKLVYTADEDKFVLTGGPPSIFDAEQGKITGVSLTFFRRDDRVLVEGATSTPVVTRTRVAP
jgi:lipopolysaccharide export system protein LptA